jgi:hypothetical protein
MASPTPPTQGTIDSITNEAIENVGKYAANATNAFEASNTLRDSMTSLGVASNVVSGIFQGLRGQLEKGGAAFGLATVGILGFGNALKDLGGIDTKSLLTFSEPIKNISDLMNGGSLVSNAMKTATDGLVKTLSGMGVPLDKISDAVKKGTGALTSLAMITAESADVGLRYSNVLFQLAGSTGSLADTYASAGANLENLGPMLKKQGQAWEDTAAATHLPIETIQRYYVELGKIPRVLNDTVKAGTDTFNSVTAVTKLATGAGRYFDVTAKDIGNTIKNYNVGLEGAAKYTARMTELNSHLGGSFDTIRGALTELSNDFVMLGVDGKNNLEGVVQIVNDYSEGLKKAGLSADQAVMSATKMTSSIKDLTIAQKSFLMSQAGGPGGLRGGFAFENMLNQGKTKEAMDMIMKQVQKSAGGGHFVTVEEASKSEAAARQLERQTKILQMFGIGKNETEAHKIIAGFGEMQAGRATGKELSKDILGDITGRGTARENLSKTDISNLRSKLNGLRVEANITNFDTVSRLMSARPMTREDLAKSTQVGGMYAKEMDEYKTMRRAEYGAAANVGGENANIYGTQLKGHAISDTAGAKAQMDRLVHHVSSISTKAYVEMLQSMYGSSGGISETEQRRSLSEEAKRNIARNPPRTSASMVGHTPEEIRKAMDEKNAKAEAGVAPAHAHTSKPGEINVNVTGYCLKCKREIETNSQSTAISVANRSY